MTRHQATVIMTIAAIFWGTNPAIIKLIDGSPLGLAWIRSGFCALVLLLFLLYRRSVSFKSLGLQLWSGFFLAANSVLFIIASLHTSPANTVLLLFIFPWITLALDFFIRGQRPLPADLLRLCLGFAGVLIIVWGGLDGDGTLGNLLALCAGVTIALHIFFGQGLEAKHQGNREVLNSIMLGWLLSIIVLAPFGLNEAVIETLTPGHEKFNLIVAFGLLSAIPWLLWGISIAYIPGHVAAALLGIEVFVAALCGWWLLGDLPDIETWIGGALTLVAATWQLLSGIDRSAKK